jgi:hypothetical protein
VVDHSLSIEETLSKAIRLHHHQHTATTSNQPSKTQIMFNKLAVASILSSTASAFTLPTSRTSTPTSSSTTLKSTVDPSVVTKKEYQDICGVEFDDANLASRLQKTSYLYPKHVEVIEDFAPLVDKMVDEIVSFIVVVCCF